MYAVGVYDFIMIHSGNAEEYMLRNFAPSSVAYLANYPLLPLCFWVLNLATGIAAPILLLLRQKIAVWVALTSGVADLVLMFISFTFLNRLDALGAQTTAFDIGIAIITFLGFAYCWWFFLCR
jgi:hypothetical protein